MRRGPVPTQTPELFIEDRAVASTLALAAEQGRGNPRTTRGPPASKAIEPAFVSIQDAATYMAESSWTIKNRLRLGQLRARKSGRRTLVEFASLKEFAEALPAAKFAPPRNRKPTEPSRPTGFPDRHGGGR
jgi:hypothetical protein